MRGARALIQPINYGPPSRESSLGLATTRRGQPWSRARAPLTPRRAAQPAPALPAHRSLDHSTSGTCCSAAAGTSDSNSSSHRICQRAGARRVLARTGDTAVAAIIAPASTVSATAAAADQVTLVPAQAPSHATIGQGAGPLAMAANDWTNCMPLTAF